PVFLDLAGKRCVVAGGSPTAAEKAQALLEAGARVEVFAPQPCTELEVLAQRPELSLTRRAYAGGDMAGAKLAIDASLDPATRQLMRADADAHGVLLNVTDGPR